MRLDTIETGFDMDIPVALALALAVALAAATEAGWALLIMVLLMPGDVRN